MATREKTNVFIMEQATRFHAALVALHGNPGASIQVTGVSVQVFNDGVRVTSVPASGPGYNRIEAEDGAALMMAASWREQEMAEANEVARSGAAMAAAPAAAGSRARRSRAKGAAK